MTIHESDTLPGKEAAMEQKPFSLEDLVNFRPPYDVQLSPDGQHVAYVRSETHKPDTDTPDG